MLRRVETYLTERKERDLGGHSPTDVVFVRTNGNPLNNQAIWHLISGWLQAAGIPEPEGEQAHAFRHTYAVGQLDRGTSLPELQALLGHKDLSTTAVYLRVTSAGLRDAAKAAPIEDILGAHESPVLQ